MTGLVAGPATSAPATSSYGCHPPGSTTIKEGQYARVFRVRGHAFACLLSRNLAYSLGEHNSFTSWSSLGPVIRLAGRYVAYELRSGGKSTDPDFAVRVLDLRTGRLRFQGLPAYDWIDSPRSGGGVTDMVLASWGAVAWIIDNPFSRTATYEVRRAAAPDPFASPERLDTGPEIAPQSLVLGGSQLTWMNAGQKRSATLRNRDGVKPRPARLRVTRAELGQAPSIGSYLSFVVRNLGDRRARPATVRVYLSQDSRFSSDDQRVLTLSLPRIAGHRQAGRITNWDPAGTSTYALVCVTVRAQNRHCRAAVTVPPAVGTPD